MERSHKSPSIIQLSSSRPLEYTGIPVAVAMVSCPVDHLVYRIGFCFLIYYQAPHALWLQVHALKTAFE